MIAYTYKNYCICSRDLAYRDINDPIEPFITKIDAVERLLEFHAVAGMPRTVKLDYKCSRHAAAKLPVCFACRIFQPPSKEATEFRYRIWRHVISVEDHLLTLVPEIPNLHSLPM